MVATEIMTRKKAKGWSLFEKKKQKKGVRVC